MSYLIDNLTEVSDPVNEPVTLADARLQLKMDSDVTSDDPLISSLITSARVWCENYLSRAFVQRQFTLSMQRFPSAIPITVYPYYSLERMPSQLYGIIELPIAKVQSVDSITYLDTNGNQQTYAGYQAIVGGRFGGKVAPPYGATFPNVRYQMGSVNVTFTAGYTADDPAAIATKAMPDPVKLAIKMLVGTWYKYREEVGDTPAKTIPRGVPSILAPLEWTMTG